MFEEKPTQWFSQTVLLFKDKIFHSDGTLRVSFTTNTQDFRYYYPPTLSISISNNFQKTFNFNCFESHDLLTSFETALKGGTNIEVQKKDSKGTIIHFNFKSSGTERVVVIIISSSETDIVKVIIPLKPVFEVFARALRYFVEHYFDLCRDLLSKSIDVDLHQLTSQIPSLIKGISSQITIPKTLLDSGAPPEIAADVEKTEMTIADLDRFVGTDMKNIKVPEIETTKEEVVLEIDSKFVKNVINNDLSNLENILNNHSLNPCPLVSLANEIKDKIDIKTETFTTLPYIKTEELQSLAYLTKLFYLLSYHNYFYNQVPIPSGTPIFKYSPETFSKENEEIAIDLLLFSGYIRTLRRRLEDKISDSTENKAIFHIQFRCFLDPFIFSFISYQNLVSLCLTRFSYYSKNGVFKKYESILELNSCPQITKDDIRSFVEEVITKASKSPNIRELHDISVKKNNLKFTTKDNFSLEQITNEIVPLELAVQNGKDLSESQFITEYKKQNKVSDEVLAFFLKDMKQKREKKEKIANIERYIKQFSGEIPDKYKDSFIEFVSKLGNKNFNFNNSTFPLEEFGDNIVKGLYNWVPENDQKLTTDYAYFCKKCEDEIMTKENILTSAVKLASSTDWSSLVE